jgi:hypothetical protein
MTVGQLLDSISSQELTEWMALASIEPFGEEREDWRAASIAAAVANAFQTHDTGPRKISDFLLRFEDAGEGAEGEDIGEADVKPEPPPDETWKRHLAMVEMLNAAYGGEDKRKKP